MLNLKKRNLTKTKLNFRPVFSTTVSKRTPLSRPNNKIFFHNSSENHKSKTEFQKLISKIEYYYGHFLKEVYTWWWFLTPMQRGLILGFGTAIGLYLFGGFLFKLSMITAAIFATLYLVSRYRNRYTSSLIEKYERTFMQNSLDDVIRKNLNFIEYFFKNYDSILTKRASVLIESKEKIADSNHNLGKIISFEPPHTLYLLTENGDHSEKFKFRVVGSFQGAEATVYVKSDGWDNHLRIVNIELVYDNGRKCNLACT